MGDSLFYAKFVKHQELSGVAIMEILIGFFMAFIISYVLYFLFIDLIAGFISVLMHF